MPIRRSQDTRPASSQLVVDDSTRAYMAELAAEIAASGNPDGDLIEEMKSAHARRQSFAAEMAEGRTDRAKKVRKVICARVYGAVVAREAIRSTFARMEEEARANFMMEVHADFARNGGAA